MSGDGNYLDPGSVGKILSTLLSAQCALGSELLDTIQRQDEEIDLLRGWTNHLSWAISRLSARDREEFLTLEEYKGGRMVPDRW